MNHDRATQKRLEDNVWPAGYRLCITELIENANQVVETVNGVKDADTVTVDYMQFWFHRFRSGISDVKDAPHTDRPVVENVYKSQK
ncbi:hypothetical protein TNCV_850941 [Trichonephila clavipes]|nr:hypothetical protein TNCV_850941 [Trichonephila clavipes]